MQAKNGAAVRVHGGTGRHETAGNPSCLNSTRNNAPSQAPRHGRLSGDTWTKTARGSVHMLHTPRAWCIDAADLTAAEAQGVTMVHIFDIEGSLNFWAMLQIIRLHGFALDRGFGPQIGLALAWWRPSREQAEELAETLQAPVAEAVQLGLFQEVR